MCQHCGCQSNNECGCGCHRGCGGHTGGFERRFKTKAEKISELEAYLAELKNEVQAVEEHLTEMRK